MIDRLRQEVRSASDLVRLMSPKYPFVIYQLVFDPGDRQPLLIGVDSWGWLAPVLIESVLAGHLPTAIGVSSLVCARDQANRQDPIRVDLDVLRGFFGDRSSELIDGIDRLRPQVDEENQEFVAGIVRSARSGLAGRVAADGTPPP
jgi:hypothetical protein